ncbi:MAG: hypothetical protein AB7H97_15525 [Pseudobdellovibrionaceae bacterium]
MKHILAFIFLFSVASTTHAGSISSGGISQIVENCASAMNDIKLEISVVDNDHLKATFLDSTSLNSISAPVVDVVHGVIDGYQGNNIKIFMNYTQGKLFANVTLLPENPRFEPRVYPNLLCASNFK